MRWLVLVIAACSSKTEEPAPRKMPVALDAAQRLPVNAASRHLGTPCNTTRAGSFVGTWVGARPFDRANPYLHRGPTSVTITESGHYTEGVGAAAIEVDLVIDGNYAVGSTSSTKDHNAVHLGDGSARSSTITIAKSAELALCVEGDKLHVARRLTASGTGIQSQDETDDVVLEREPPPPPLPPPPEGFEVLANEQAPRAMALSPDDVFWAHWNGDTPATHAIRAVPRAGGAVRELAGKLDNVLDIEVWGEHLYIAEYGKHRILRVPLAGGEIETVVDEVAASTIAVAKGMLVWSVFETVYSRAVTGGKPRQIIAPRRDLDVHDVGTDGASAFVVFSTMDRDKTGSVVRVPVGGGALTTLARENVCSPLTLHRGAVYWGGCDGELHRGATRLVADLPNIEGIAIAGSTIVIAIGMGIGEVRTAPLGGGKSKVLVNGRFNPERVLVDPNDPAWVYVSDGGLIGYGTLRGRIGRIKLGKST